MGNKICNCILVLVPWLMYDLQVSSFNIVFHTSRIVSFADVPLKVPKLRCDANPPPPWILDDRGWYELLVP